MTTSVETGPETRDHGVSLPGMRFGVFTMRNFIFLCAVLAMNYTLSRPSPVDMLYILSFLITLFYLTISQKQQVTRRVLTLTLLLGSWAVAYVFASLPYFGEKNVPFELLAKTFAISIGLIGAFVSMTWTQRHFETFMRVYIVSCTIGSVLGTIGFVLQNAALTWDGRARGLIDDPNMYGSFLLPAAVFCAYFLSRPGRGKLLLWGALGLVTLGIVLSFSRIAQVALIVCMLAYLIFHYRRRHRTLVLILVGLVGLVVVVFAAALLAPSEFSAKFFDRLTFAKSYDLGEEGRYRRYLLVLPMILQNPMGLGVLQLEKIFPEPIHNIWLSSFVNYGWLGGFTWLTLVISTVYVGIQNYRRTRSEVMVALLISLIGIIMCTSLHEGEHWRHLWLAFGLVWGFSTLNFPAAPKPAAKTPSPNRRTHAGRPAARRVGVSPSARPQAAVLPADAARR